MIDNDLHAPPGSPLVRGLTACVSSLTEVPIEELPGPVDDAPIVHTVAALKTWLAGRGFGMVPISEPRSFQWAGSWIAVVDTEHGQAACVAFGTPPGIVLSPQDPALLGQATADLAISSAYAVASLDRWSARCRCPFRSREPSSRSPSHRTPRHPCSSSSPHAPYPATACRVHPDRLNGTTRLRALIHRGGLRVDLVEGGELRAGMPITTT